MNHEIQIKNSGRIYSSYLYHLPFISTIYSLTYLILYFTLSTKQIDNIEINIPTKSKELWRIWTYQFAHGSNAHIAVNIFTTMIYGGILEIITMFRMFTDRNVYQRWRMIVIHLSSIIGGGFAVGWQRRIIGGNGNLMVIGASGGTYGMLASIIAHLFLNWGEMSFIRRFMYLTTISSACISDVVVNIIIPASNVSYSAHVGGFLFGLMSAIIFIKNSVEYKHEVIVRSSIIVFFTSTIIASGVNLFLLK